MAEVGTMPKVKNMAGVIGKFFIITTVNSVTIMRISLLNRIIEMYKFRNTKI
jgi:hypothetical protein